MSENEKYDSEPDINKHRLQVAIYIDNIVSQLLVRKIKHDKSKLTEPEKSAFDIVTPLLAKLTYGSDEYHKILDNQLKPALEEHYRKNRHHPEYHPNGIRDMTLVDVIEMFCDWCAATDRHNDGDIGKSIEHNQKRFKYDDTLAAIFAHTAQEYGMGKGSHRASVGTVDKGDKNV